MSTLVILSGGMDSATALAHTLTLSSEVEAITFDYGQRHRRELQSAGALAHHYGIPLEVADIRGLLSGSALLGAAPVPHGRYDAPSMSVTVVPGRNLLFAAVACARLRPRDQLALGVHAGDHAIYPDCRPEFWSEVATAIDFGYDIGVQTPFIHMTKADIASYADKLNVPLRLTWSCYQGGDEADRHCGRCGTCVERAEAFDLAGVPDPTDYADADYWREAIRS